MNKERILSSLTSQIELTKEWIIASQARGENNQVSKYNDRLQTLESLESKIKDGFWI